MKNKGFTLLIAMVTTSLLLIVSFVVSNIALKQLVLANASKESQYAFYNADSGVECATYWDLKDPTSSPFDPNGSPTNITCNTTTRTVGGGGSNLTSTFTIPLPTGCVVVSVTKNVNDTTTIDSRGYNTCTAGAIRKYERGVNLTYDNLSTGGSPTNIALGKPVTQFAPFGSSPGSELSPSNLTDGNLSSQAYPAHTSLSYSVDLGSLTSITQINIAIGRAGVASGQSGEYGYIYSGDGTPYITSWQIDVVYDPVVDTYVSLASGSTIPNADNIGATPSAPIRKIKFSAQSSANWIGVYELEAYQ